MKDLFRNQKLKRILSRFLVFVVIITTFFHSDITDANAADSNDRRRTVIKLAQGAQLTEMEELQEMSYDDLRLFALYLSNYYIPFKTEFQPDATNEDLIDNMTNALAKHVGLSEDLADYFAQVTMGSVTQTAQQLYVPYDAVRAIHCAIGVSTNGDGGSNYEGDSSVQSVNRVDKIWKGETYNGVVYWNDGRVAGASGSYTLGTAGRGSAKTGTNADTSLMIWNLDKYVELLGGIKNVNNIKYMPLTYPVLLQLIDYTKRMASWDSTYQGYYNNDSDKNFSTEGIQSNSFSKGDILCIADSSFKSDGYFFQRLFYTKDSKDNYPYRYIRNYNATLNKPLAYGGEKTNIYNIAETCYAPIVWFEKVSDTEEIPHTVFSNNEACMMNLAAIFDTVNLSYGYGSAFLNVTSQDDINDYSDNLIKLSAFCATMYTDWVGNICIWNGLTYKVIVPAACNPYAFSELTDYSHGQTVAFDTLKNTCNKSNVYGAKTNLLNFIGIKQGGAVTDNLFRVAGEEQDTAEGYSWSYILNNKITPDGTIFNLRYYRVYEGTDDYEFDATSSNSWGKYEPIFKAFEGTGNNGAFHVVGTFASDLATFPSWYHLQESSMWNEGSVDYRRHRVMMGYSGTNGWNDFWGNYTTTMTHYLADKDPWYSSGLSASDVGWSKRYATQFSTSQPMALTQGLYVDNLGGVGNSTDLSSFFKYANLVKANGIASSLTSSINFSAVQKDDAANTFTGTINKVTAQSLFLTYAFAYYNGAAYAKGETEGKYDKDAHIVNLKFNAELFPSGAGNLDFSQVQPIEDTTEDEVLSMVYYLLHPSEGISYFATWIKNKVGGLFIGWHEDIVGSSDSNSSLGMTQYLGTSGYATTPNLSDIGWIESLLDSYDNIIVYILIILAIIMLCYIILGQLSVQRAVIGFVMFGICAFLPPYIMNFTINTSNNVADRIFTEKFDYWALVQTEEYLGQLQGYYNATQASDSTEGLAYLIAMNSTSGGQASETGYGSMRVKWISPKKYSDLAELTEALNSETSSNILVKNASDNMKSLVISSIASTTSGEDFSGADSLYLYRDILDIYRAGAITYNVMAQQSNSSITHGTIGTEAAKYLKLANMSATITSDTLAVKTYTGPSAGTKVPDYYALIEYDSDGKDLAGDVDNYISSFEAMQKGFIPTTSAATNNSQNYYTSKNLATTYLVSYHAKYYEIYQKYNKAVNKSGTIDISWSGALDWPKFKDTLFANPNVSGFNYGTGHIVSAITGLAADGETPTKVTTNKDNLDALYYAIYSESPYYFLDYQVRDVLRANGLYSYDMKNPTGKKNGGNTNSMVTLFLKDNQAYFYNYKNNEGYGELRDYLNMHDFFYLVIPSLRSNADIIRWFDKQYTFDTHDTCSLRRQMDGSFKYNGETIILPDGEWNTTKVGDFNTWYKALNEQERYEFWHDLNVNLLCYYSCTWLDAMLDCEYAKPEKIKIGADNYTVQEPLNPYSYYETDTNGNIVKGRPMIFSRSEMRYYGLQEHNLTTVEKKIIELNDNIYKKSLDLTNYYTLSDETLIHAYSMICLFEFNNLFSETNPFGEDYILYPLGYELKAVTYDGYLRLMLYASSGEDLMYNDADGNKSIYTRIQEKTSIFFGIGLVVNDLFAVYALPALKLFFLILLFLTSILIIIAGAIKLDLNLINVIWKSLLAPMLSFTAVSIGLCIVSSLFMSNGASGVYESAPVIALGDPTALILVQLIINIVVLILYWKMVKKAFKDFKTYVTSVFNDIAGSVTGALGKIAGIATGAHVVNKLSKGAKERGNRNKGVSAGGAAVAGAAGAAGVNAASDAEAHSQELKEKAAADQKAYNDKATTDKQAKLEAKAKAKADKAEMSALNKNEKQLKAAEKAKQDSAKAQEQLQQNRAKRNAIKNNKNLSKEEKDKQIAKLNKQNKALANKRDNLSKKSRTLVNKSDKTLDIGTKRSDKLRANAQARAQKMNDNNVKRNAKIDKNIQKSAHKSTQKQAKLANKEAKQARKNLVRRRK